MTAPRPHLLPARPTISADLLRRVTSDYERLATAGLPTDLEGYLLDAYRLDVTGRYAGFPLKNPWGKASGQLSMKASQVQEAAEAGLGFVVLKTVIAQDASGDQSMAAWAVRESRMTVERVVGKGSGDEGWTVSWKGRGWWQTFDEYCGLVRESVSAGVRHNMVVAPSVKYHLPGPGESRWRTEEYAETTRGILDAYRAGGAAGPLPLEKDFSPTLAGSDRSSQRELTLEWLTTVTGLVRDAVGSGEVRVGLKMFNSLEDDGFQTEMLERVHGPDRPDFLVYANRLFDPDRTYEGQKGIAYGGPDLSDRNLQILSRYRRMQAEGLATPETLELSGTGDIHSGRMAVEYALRGCTSFQLHTLFQLPAEEFFMKRGGKIDRVIHHLVFHPESGLIVWLLHAAERLGLRNGGVARLTDVADLGSRSALKGVDLDA